MAGRRGTCAAAAPAAAGLPLPALKGLRQELRGHCARSAPQAAAARLTAESTQVAALQGKVRRLQEELAHQARLLAAARDEAARLRQAAALADRGGSMSSEATSEESVTAARLESEGGDGAAGPGVDHQFGSTTGPSRGPRHARDAGGGDAQLAGSEAAASEGRCSAEAAQGAPQLRAPPLPPAGTARPSAPRPSAPLGRAAAVLGGAARRLAAAALQRTPRPAPLEVANPASAPPRLDDRSSALERRAAAAELWASPAVEEYCRAAVVGHEWAARGELLQLERESRLTAADAALLAQLRPKWRQLGADGVLRLQDRDGSWLSKSGFRRKHRNNNEWGKALRRVQRLEQAEAAERRKRSKKAEFCFNITAIARCVASYAKRKWAIVCRGTAIGFLSMANVRWRCWRMARQFCMQIQQREPNAVLSLPAGPCAVAYDELATFKDNLQQAGGWRGKGSFIRRVEAWQATFEFYRVQFADLHWEALGAMSSLMWSHDKLSIILAVPPEDVPP
eukprot:TRINITY_DN3944_c1_g1_i2.p1 TRINITY_DN3944_c1_g1~~TRINITY_DN3944_c1_g1_i2.p1  ORF type:complete len:536 (+),score=125.90 TRINITY_DN3944_c1_g1_i2:82-1608(+)